MSTCIIEMNQRRYNSNLLVRNDIAVASTLSLLACRVFGFAVRFCGSVLRSD